MIETGTRHDEVRRVPVYSLYSETREPTAEMLRDLDVLVIDLQDVGTRIYTYIYTMANCLKAARKQGLKVIVCDRPNPIGGAQVEGPMLVPGFESFVGLYPDPDAARHDDRRARAALQRALRHRRRPRGRADGGLAARHVLRRRPASPGSCRRPTSRRSTRRSSIPGGVLFEGTNVSEGRGTTRPFELLGAPWVVAERFADAMNRRELPGRVLPSGALRADVSQARGKGCGGCQIHVLDRRTFRPVEAGVALIEAFRASDPDQFRWRDPPYEYEYEQAAVRHPGRLVRAAGTDRGGRAARARSRGRGKPPSARSEAARTLSALLNR